MAGKSANLYSSHRLEATSSRISILTSQPTDNIHFHPFVRKAQVRTTLPFTSRTASAGGEARSNGVPGNCESSNFKMTITRTSQDLARKVLKLFDESADHMHLRSPSCMYVLSATENQDTSGGDVTVLALVGLPNIIKLAGN
jgi:hypothetical protein